MNGLGRAPVERAQEIGDSPHIPERNFPEGVGDFESFMVRGHLDDYYRGTRDMHVRCIVREIEFCIVLQSLIGREPPVIQPSIWSATADFRSSQPSGVDWQLRMAVLVGESVEHRERMSALALIPSEVRRLGLLENCNCARVHVPGERGPSLPLFPSLRIFPLNARFPDALEKDGEHLTVSFGDQSGGQVVESGTEIVNEVRRDQRDDIGRLTGVPESPDGFLALALTGLSDRVWVGSAVPGDFPFEVDEVLLGPIELEVIGTPPTRSRQDGLPLEDDARRPGRPGADTGDTGGTRDPGADA
jgi:hypothetical protein